MTREGLLLAVKYAYQMVYMKKGEKFYYNDSLRGESGQIYIGSKAGEKYHINIFWVSDREEIIEDVEPIGGPFHFQKKKRNPLEMIRQREMTREELVASGIYNFPVSLTKELDRLIETGSIVDPVQEVLLPLIGIRIFPPNEVEMVGFEMGKWGKVRFVNKARRNTI
jgi:hypothetical protein